MPLFLTTNPANHRQLSQPRTPHSTPHFKVQSAQRSLVKDMRIQNATLIVPETIFFDRMPAAAKNEVSDLVKLYR